MTTIASHLSKAELEARYETAADPVSKSHFHAVWLLSLNYGIEEVGSILSFSTRWVRLLLKRYNEQGPDSLGDRRHTNGTAPAILTPEALFSLKERLKTPPEDGGLWTGPKVARWLAQFHDRKSVHKQRGWDALVAIGYSIQKPRPRHPEAASEAEREELKNCRTPPTKKNAIIRTPPSSSGQWTSIGSALSQLREGVWAPKGKRPVALGHHRYEWLYVWGFVEPATGATVWNVSNAVCKEMFEAILADFAKSAGAGATKRIVLQLDGAGWHGPENIAVPDGVRLVFQPAHSPELQPAEHLWAFVDEPLVNIHFKTIGDLEKVVSERCVALAEQSNAIRASTFFHWWPTPSEEK